MNVEELSAIAVDCGLKVHRDLGPGILESAYESRLAHFLAKRGLYVERQKIIPIIYDGSFSTFARNSFCFPSNM